MFICNAQLSWVTEGWNDTHDDYSYKRKLKWYRRHYGKDVKPRFGLIRITATKFLRDVILNEDTWFCYKKRNGEWKFNKWIFIQIRYKLDKDFMRRLYIPFYQWYAYAKFAKEQAESEVSEHVCLSDPMNGCPGDFAEDFNRQHHIKWCYAEKLKCPDWFKAQVTSYYHKKAWDNYYENPAPWDMEDEEFNQYYEKCISNNKNQSI